jgi:fatty-acyl-CoA synthase
MPLAMPFQGLVVHQASGLAETLAVSIMPPGGHSGPSWLRNRVDGASNPDRDPLPRGCQLLAARSGQTIRNSRRKPPPLADRTIGKVWCTSPSLMKEYFRDRVDPGAVCDGWLDTLATWDVV